MNLTSQANVLTEPVTTCLVLGGSDPAFVQEVALLLVRELNQSYPVVAHITHHGTTDIGTPRDIVHAQRGQSCVIQTDSPESFRNLNLADGDPRVVVVMLN